MGLCSPLVISVLRRFDSCYIIRGLSEYYSRSRADYVFNLKYRYSFKYLENYFDNMCKR